MTNTPSEIVYTARATVNGGRRGGHGKTVVAQHPAGMPFSIWSAASSTGEEI